MTRATVFSWLRLPVFSEKARAYGQSKRDFYESRIYLQNLDKLSSIFNSNQLDNIPTDKSITFYGVKFGYSSKEVINKLGKPNYRTTEKRLFHDHKIIFYRLKIATVNCILQLHFNNDSFFLGIIEMRTGDETLKERLFDLISQKYNLDEPIVGNFIQDGSGNRILVKEDVVPYVVYSAGSREIRAELINSVMQPSGSMNHFRLKNQDLLIDMI